MDLISPGIAKGAVDKIGALDIQSAPLTHHVLTEKSKSDSFLFCQFIFAWRRGKKAAKTKKNLNKLYKV